MQQGGEGRAWAKTEARLISCGCRCSWGVPVNACNGAQLPVVSACAPAIHATPHPAVPLLRVSRNVQGWKTVRITIRRVPQHIGSRPHGGGLGGCPAMIASALSAPWDPGHGSAPDWPPSLMMRDPHGEAVDVLITSVAGRCISLIVVSSF